MRKIPQNLKKLSPLLMVAVLSSFTLIALGRKMSQSDIVPKVVEAEEIRTEIETVSETQQETLLDTTEPLQLSFSVQDGEYEGVGVGYAGNIKVLVTIQNNRIIEIQVLEEQDSTAFEGAEGFFRNGQRVIDNILKQQDWEVDTISGATFSSRGIISAVRNALTGEVDFNIPEVQPFTASVIPEMTQPIFEDAPSSSDAKYRDGIFIGKGFGFGGEMAVSVSIAQGQITDISIMENQETPEYLNLAKQITNSIVSAQSTNVDAISGATFSSNGILQAVNSALNQARTAEAQESDSYNIDRNDSVAETMAVSQEDVPSSMWEAENTSGWTDGIYSGQAQGYGGLITVSVTVQDGMIADVQVISHQETPEFYAKAEILPSQIIRANTPDIDGISGATFSSEGIKNAVKSALSQAGGNATENFSVEIPEGDFPCPDGVYYGTGEGYGGNVNVAIVIRDNTITSAIVADAQNENQPYLNHAKQVIDRIIASQSTDVDTVSGATYSSKGIIQAVNSALKSAENSSFSGNGSYQDGSYLETAVCSPDENFDFEDYRLHIKVRISQGNIITIDSMDNGGSEQFQRALSGVTEQILQKQSVDGIDAVSGATCSSKAITEAVKQALSQARK